MIFIQEYEEKAFESYPKKCEKKLFWREGISNENKEEEDKIHFQTKLTIFPDQGHQIVARKFIFYRIIRFYLRDGVRERVDTIS